MKPKVISASGVTPDAALAIGNSFSAEYRIEGSHDFESMPDLFSYPVKNFGRFPSHVKAACHACALALKAGGISYGKGGKKDMALLASGYEPTLQINGEFYRDYLESGRTLGRGNLFIYTLPTASIAEVSIHFGLTGPSLFIEADIAPFERLNTAASQMIENKEAETATLFWQDEQYTFCVIIAAETPEKGGICRLKKLKTRAAGWRCPEEAIMDIRSKIRDG